MKRNGLVAIAFSLLMMSCNGQTRSGDSQKISDANKPKVSIRVNKKYDKNGNVIGYDSTYSSVYSNVKNDTIMRDSLMRIFDKKNLFTSEPFFKHFFADDSAMNDLLSKDFLSKSFGNNIGNIDSMLQGMNMFKDDFFKNHFDMPGVLEAPGQKKNSEAR
jgi:hypothetical protein